MPVITDDRPIPKPGPPRGAAREDQEGPGPDPVVPRGTDDRGPEWDRVQDQIRSHTPKREQQSLRAKIIQKSVYLTAAQGALNGGLPQTAMALATCSRPLSQAVDRIAKKNAFVDRVVSLVEGTQSDAAILVGLHACVLSAFALESGFAQRIVERNAFLRNSPFAQGLLASLMVAMIDIPEKLLVRADIESEKLDEVVDKLTTSARALLVDQAAARDQQDAGSAE